VRDLTSRNGTFVNGERVLTERPLHRGDEIRIGRSRLVYRPESSTIAIDLTATPHGVPDLTRREPEVLLALFNGRIPDAAFVEPASTREIATALHVTDAAVNNTW
jgi:predicted component of type VI protein secretion system